MNPAPYLLAALLALGSAQAADPAATEADLGRIRREIAALQKEIDQETSRRDALAARLRDAELTVAGARRKLAEVRALRAQSEQRRSDLQKQKLESERFLSNERAVLAGELRAAYTIGRNEQFKLLLNQQDPARLGRMLAYYGYFGRSRAARIDGIRAELERLLVLERSLAVENERLAQLEQSSRDELQALQSGRRDRSQVLTELEQELKSRGAQLARLKREEGTLEQLLTDLRRLLPEFPAGKEEPFEKRKGRLLWPVPGKLVEGFGRGAAGGISRSGVRLSTERGAQVRAVYFGRVIFADWLPGLGLLLILEHSGGYLSLYGHNDQLFKSVGDWVAPGDVISAVGDSGGRARPELYFEIRKGARPLDPGQWMGKTAPQR